MSSHHCPVALLNALGVLPYAASFDHVGPTLLSCDDHQNLHNTQQTQACSVEHMQHYHTAVEKASVLEASFSEKGWSKT